MVGHSLQTCMFQLVEICGVQGLFRENQIAQMKARTISDQRHFIQAARKFGFTAHDISFCSFDYLIIVVW